MARKGGMADGQVPARTQWVDGGRERGGRSKVGGVGRGKPRSSKERRPDSSGKAAGPKIRVELMERPLLPKLARFAPPDSEPRAIRAARFGAPRNPFTRCGRTETPGSPLRFKHCTATPSQARRAGRRTVDRQTDGRHPDTSGVWTDERTSG